MSIILHIADSSQEFTEQNIKTIKQGIYRAQEHTIPRLNIAKDIDLVVTSELPDFLIPEDYLGARTYNGHFILLSIAQHHVVEDLVYEVVCHEMCHAARWQRNPEAMKNLFDGMILEGLAVNFEQQAVADQSTKQYFLKTMLERTDEENIDILNIIKDDIDNEYYDYYTIFITGNQKEHLPRWSGYSAGYYLVKEYMANTGKTIEQIYAEPFDNFRTVLPWQNPIKAN